VWHTGFLRLFSKATRLCRQGRFEPDEAFRLGLLQPDFEMSRLDEYTSRKITTKLQKAVNPESWEQLLKDKGLFYRYLMALGLPVPRLYAVFLQKIAGWSPDSGILTGTDDWQLFFEKLPADEFVIKPSRGAFGEGLKIFKRESGIFKDTKGNVFTAADIYNLMRADTKADSFVVQQRLCSHPEINRLNPSEYLQTVRVTTFIDRKGRFRILFAFLKLIGGSNITDNFHAGLSGNMFAVVNTQDGSLVEGRLIPPDGKGIRFFERHPQTGIEFKTFIIPYWPQVIALVQKAAFGILPVRAVGWDIAVTPQDIKIVEGNIWWNPLNLSRWKDALREELKYKF
jgi:hypothetical protein